MFNKLLTRKGRLEDKIQTELNQDKPELSKIIKVVDDYEFDNIKTISKLKKDKKVELKRINGALKSTIDAHGPITKLLLGSATKRVHGSLINNQKPEKPKEKISIKVFLVGVISATLINLLIYFLLL